MGNYLSEDQARNRFESIFNVYLDKSTNRENSTWLSEDITGVEATIDAHVSQRYEVPITNPDGVAVLRAIAIKLLQAVMYSRMPGSALNDSVMHDEDNARRDLRFIAQGKISLGNEAPEENEERSAGLIVTYNTPQMTRSKLKGF